MKKLSKTIFGLVCFLLLAVSTVSAASVPEAYHPIIRKYIDNYKAGNLNQGELGYSLEDFTGPELYQNNGFGFDDWNSDGSPELLIGDNNYGNLQDIYAIYTIVNGAPMLVAKNNDYGENFGYKTQDKCASDPSVANCVVKEKFFKDAHRVVYEYYKMQGPNLNFVKSYTFNDNEDYTEPKYYTSTDPNNPLQTEIANPGELTETTLYTNIPTTGFSEYDDVGTTPGQPASPNRPAVEGPAGTIYRLCHPLTNEHLYTSQIGEAISLVNGGWKYEGYSWQAPESGIAVYRLYNPVLNDHLYTTDENEVNTLVANHGWQKDNSGNALFYSGGEKPVYRLYNPANGQHLLTTDGNEYVVLGNNGWNQEGTALHCL